MKKTVIAVVMAIAATTAFALNKAPTSDARAAAQKFPPKHQNEQVLIKADNPVAILEIAKGFGSAALDKDRQGDPKIVGRIDGTPYQILFFGCTDNRNCDNIEFSARWSDAKVTIAQLNKWNQNKRYGKAYLDSTNNTMLEMDVNLDFGVSRKNLEDTFDYWSKVLRTFKNEILDQ